MSTRRRTTVWLALTIALACTAVALVRAFHPPVVIDPRVPTTASELARQRSAEVPDPEDSADDDTVAYLRGDGAFVLTMHEIALAQVASGGADIGQCRAHIDQLNSRGSQDVAVEQRRESPSGAGSCGLADGLVWACSSVHLGAASELGGTGPQAREPAPPAVGVEVSVCAVSGRPNSNNAHLGAFLRRGCPPDPAGRAVHRGPTRS